MFSNANGIWTDHNFRHNYTPNLLILLLRFQLWLINDKICQRTQPMTLETGARQQSLNRDFLARSLIEMNMIVYYTSRLMYQQLLWGMYLFFSPIRRK